jgi:hypothetical protein
MREEEKLMSEQNKNKKVLVVIEPSILFYIFYIKYLAFSFKIMHLVTLLFMTNTTIERGF